MKKPALVMIVVAILAVGVSPAFAGGGSSPDQTADVGVGITVLTYYKVWVSPASVALVMDPGASWEITPQDVTLSYFAVIPATTSAPIDASLNVTTLASGCTMWFDLDVNDAAHSDTHITATGVYDLGQVGSYAAGDAINQDKLTLSGNIGQGIPVSGQPLLQGTLTLTIGPAV